MQKRRYSPRDRLVKLRKMLQEPYTTFLRQKVQFLLDSWPDTPEKPLVLSEAQNAMGAWPSFKSVAYRPSEGSEAFFSHALFNSDGKPTYKHALRFWVPGLLSPWSSGYMVCPEDHPEMYGTPQNVYGIVGVFWDRDGVHSVQPFLLSERNFKNYIERNDLSPLSEEDVSIKCHTPNSPYSFRCTGTNMLKEAFQDPTLANQIKREIAIASSDLELFMASPLNLKKLEQLRRETQNNSI